MSRVSSVSEFVGDGFDGGVVTSDEVRIFFLSH